MFLNRKAYYLLIGLFCFAANLVSGQNQKIADSLINIYEEGNMKGAKKLDLLHNLSYNEKNNLEASLKYAEELIILSKQESNYLYLHRGYIQKGSTHRLMGDLNAALDAFFKSAQASKEAKYIEGEGSTYTAIADTYSEIGNSANAEIYYDKAIVILRKTNDSIALATTLLNAGDEYFNSKKYEFALRNFEESGRIFERVNYKIGKAYNLGNVGMVYAEQGKDSLATNYLNDAITILEELEVYDAISEYLTYMSDIYMKQNNSTAALSYAQRSFDLAHKYGLKKQISESSLTLSELYEREENIPVSYYYYKKHIAYRDSVTNLEGIAKMADLRTDYEVSQKQVEVDLLEQKRKNQRVIVIATIVASFLIGLLAIGQFRRVIFIRKTNQLIEKERDRSDKLLLNILPEETAQELKDNGRVVAKKYPSTTVLFSDFKGFTSYAENLSPEQLVETIDHYFSKFDLIMEKYGLVKIKTIGDAYMAVGGLSYDNVDQAKEMILAAKEMNDFVAKAKIDEFTTATFDIRIGINTGPVVAGVVGTKKFAYDIWGDAVNVASRMESNSEAGRINISENTYVRVKSYFDCEYRGEIEVKNRGSMKMYFVN